MTRRLTRHQVRLVDQGAVDHFHMSSLLLMENAGRNAAEIIRQTYGDPGQAFIVCGVGNNGGDGCVIARHLANAGWSVRLLIAGDMDRASADMRSNRKTVEAMALPLTIASTAENLEATVKNLRADEIVVDALLGTGFQGEVRPPLDTLIRALNKTPKRACVAVDLPSGLDCDTGKPSNATIRADLTVTFVADKIGFASPEARPYLGRVVVADIGVPMAAIQEAIQASLR